jgi:hypothetical protein
MTLEQFVEKNCPYFVSRSRSGAQERITGYPATGDPKFEPMPLDDLDALRLRHLGRSTILLPGPPKPYGTVEELDQRIIDHFQRYVAVPPGVLPILPLYVRYTWLADRFQTAPYLYLTGPSGSGKSRTSQVIGHICRRPYMTNSTASEAALNRTIEMLGVCTTVIDENEYEETSDAQRAITKMLRVGFEANGAVERCDEVSNGDRRSHRPVRLPVFGPKIVCAINHVPDAPLITIPIHMSRAEKPVELPLEYLAQVQELQSMLLQYRLDMYFAELNEPKRLDVSGRLLQLYWPLAKVATDEQLAGLDQLILDLQAERDSETESKGEYHIGEAIRILAENEGVERVDYERIRNEAFRSRPSITSQEIGYFVKSRLGLPVKRDPGNRGPRWIDAPKETILAALEGAGYCLAKAS